MRGWWVGGGWWVLYVWGSTQLGDSSETNLECWGSDESSDLWREESEGGREEEKKRKEKKKTDTQSK